MPQTSKKRELVMTWTEGQRTEDYRQYRGLAVEISFEDEVLYRHAAEQRAEHYNPTTCLKSVFYWMLDNHIMDDVQLSDAPEPPARDPQDELPF